MGYVLVRYVVVPAVLWPFAIPCLALLTAYALAFLAASSVGALVSA